MAEALPLLKMLLFILDEIQSVASPTLLTLSQYLPAPPAESPSPALSLPPSLSEYSGRGSGAPTSQPARVLPRPPPAQEEWDAGKRGKEDEIQRLTVRGLAVLNRGRAVLAAATARVVHSGHSKRVGI